MGWEVWVGPREARTDGSPLGLLDLRSRSSECTAGLSATRRLRRLVCQQSLSPGKLHPTVRAVRPRKYTRDWPRLRSWCHACHGLLLRHVRHPNSRVLADCVSATTAGWRSFRSTDMAKNLSRISSDLPTTLTRNWRSHPLGRPGHGAPGSSHDVPRAQSCASFRERRGTVNPLRTSRSAGLSAQPRRTQVMARENARAGLRIKQVFPAALPVRLERGLPGLEDFPG